MEYSLIIYQNNYQLSKKEIQTKPRICSEREYKKLFFSIHI